jgi:hypothetical protein
VDLDRLLWVRPRNAGETVRAAELVLETGGFTVVVLDLGVVARSVAGEARERRGALRMRLARAVERAGAVALVLAERPWAGTLAGATVVMARGEARWGGARGGPRWLEGLALKLQVERGGVRVYAGAAVLEPDVIARSPGFTGETKQSRYVDRTATGLDAQKLGGDKPRPYTDEAGVETALGA